MKQRLLLALLVLFASVGSTWGQITIEAPANSGDIKVQFTADLREVVGTVPAVSGFTLAENAWTSTNNTVTITIPTTSSTGATYTITRAEGSNYTGITVTNTTKNTGKISISDAVITSFTCKENGLEKLTVTSAANLTTLDCSKNKIDNSNWDLSTSAPKLTSLTCNDNELTGTINLGTEVTSINCTENKLTGVTGGKIDTDGSSKLTITAGTQTATYGQTEASHLPHANEWFDITKMFVVPSASSREAQAATPVTLGFYTDASKVKVNSIKKMVNGSKTNANYITNSGVNNNEYKFYSSSNGYEYGSYVLELGTTETGKTGITYEINFLVAPAKFTLTTSQDDGIDEITVTSSAATKVGNFTYTYSGSGNTKTAYQGNLLTVSSTLEDNYSFAKYTNLDGLKTDDDATKVTTMEVTGTKSKVATEQIISFKATSTIAQRTLTLVPVAADGSYTVTRKDGKPIENNKVPHGTEIVIEAFPNPDCEVDVIKIGSTEYTTSGSTYKIIDNKVSCTVAVNTTIAVTFKKKTASGVKVTVYAPNFTKVTVNSNYIWQKEVGAGQVVAFGTEQPLNSHTFTVAVESNGSNSIKVNSITMNNTTNGTVVDNGATFTVAETVTAVTFVVDAIEQEEPVFIPTGTEQTVKYDGSAKTFAYTTNPAGETFTLSYAKKNDSSYDEAVTTAPTNVGEYKVQYKKKYADTWLPTGETIYTLKIEKADLTLSLPSISMVTTNGITKYQLSGGSASFNNRSVTGSFTIYNGPSENTSLIVPDANKDKSHTVTVKFVPKSAQDKANYNEATATVTINVSGKDAVKTYTVKGTLTNGITVSVYNGNASLNSSSISSGISVAEGSNIRLVFKVPDGKQIDDILNDTGATPTTLKNGSNWSDNTLTLSALDKNINFALQVSDVAAKSKFKITVAKDYETTYDGTVKSVVPNESSTTYFTVMKADDNAPANGTYTLVYAYKQNGQVVKSPTNAGTYDVEITVQPAGNLASTYQATTASMKMIVKKATPEINTPPTASVVGKGAKLSSSILTGGSASVPGTFVWAAPETIVEATGKFVVIFKPTDSTNYEEAYGTGEKMAEVKVTDKAVLSISQNEHCTIKVTAGNKTYSNGETIPVGTTITITATPAATYKVTKILVNGTAISGTTYTTTAAPINISVEVEQEFTVSVSTLLKGIELVLPPTSNVVKKGESYSFSVKGLAADLANLVVSDGTNIYTGTNGAYTISNITANKTITVTMKAGTAPTQVEAVIEANLSTQGKSMGTVTVTKISSLRADAVDSSIQKFYYGDKIRITATPAAGCRFVGWEGRTETSSVIDVTITDTSYKFKAVFAGSPTGAEVIEGVDIYGSNGEIVVKCDGAARITIVSMNGQSKQQEISGDTRIPAGAGIYGIVFEQGKNVMRTKVAVK